MKKVRDFYCKQSEACAGIILRVTPSQLTHCHDPDLMTIWNNLITIHSSCGRSTIIALHHRFHHLHLEHTETMSTYVAQVQHVAFLLEEADVTATNDDIILAITSGLPRSYDSFLISLDATYDDNYMLAYVIAHLVNEYQRQHAHHHQSSTNSTDVALAASTPCDLLRIMCFNCRKKGHYQINCPDHSTTQSAPATTVTGKSSKANQAALADETNVSC